MQAGRAPVRKEPVRRVVSLSEQCSPVEERYLSTCRSCRVGKGTIGMLHTQYVEDVFTGKVAQGLSADGLYDVWQAMKFRQLY